MGFCEKNADNLKTELRDLMHASSNVLVAKLYPSAGKSTGNKKSTQADIFLKQLVKLTKTIHSTTVCMCVCSWCVWMRGKFDEFPQQTRVSRIA